MRVIPVEKLEAANLVPHERFFVELWYSMTHDLSLDSYRVKCMNARWLVREVRRELAIGLVNDQELKALCDELSEVLVADSIVSTKFQSHADALQPLLAKPPKAESKDKRNASRDWLRFCCAMRDLEVALDAHYFPSLCEALPATIGKGNQAEIKKLTSALLSELVAQGWPLESLYGWHRHFLKAPPTYSFAQNLDFMLRQLVRGPQAFRVTLRLSGSSRLADIPAFHDFRLIRELTISDSERRRIKGMVPDKFLRPHRYVTFATATVESLDETSAAVEARMKVEDLLDLLRFDFEHRVVKVDRRTLVQRQGDGRIELLELRHIVPNPRLMSDLEDFGRLAKQVDAVFAKEHVAATSRRQLQTAIRHYRFGSDAEGYRDKFTAWWTGLEALTSLGDGRSIGDRVVFNASRAMLFDYLHRLLRDLLGTLRHLDVVMPPDCAALTGCTEIGALSVPQLVQILQSKQHADAMWGTCTAHPVLVFRGHELHGCLSDPKKLRARLDEHCRHLEWHLSRLYRIRCCLVHGSPVEFHLGLYAANLEFYLKETIRFVLTTLVEFDHVVSLEELFQRAASRYDRVMTLLDDKGAGGPAVATAVFSGVVNSEPANAGGR